MANQRCGDCDGWGVLRRVNVNTHVAGQSDYVGLGPAVHIQKDTLLPIDLAQAASKTDSGFFCKACLGRGLV